MGLPNWPPLEGNRVKVPRVFSSFSKGNFIQDDFSCFNHGLVFGQPSLTERSGKVRGIFCLVQCQCCKIAHLQTSKCDLLGVVM